MKKQQASLINAPQSLQPTLPHTPSPPHKNKQHLSQTKPNRIQQQLTGKRQLKEQKHYLMKEMLHLLGCEKSKRVFEQESQELRRLKNPEEYSNKKSHSIKKDSSKHLNQQDLMQIILNSANVQQILDKIQSLSQEGNTRIAEYESNLGCKKAEKMIRMLFPIQQHAMIPIYKNISIKCDKRVAVLLDTNEQDHFCLLDDDNYLHLLKSSSEKRQLKIQGCKILLMVWIGKQTLVVINSNNKMYFYNNALQLLRVYKLQINTIQFIDLKILNHSRLQDIEKSHLSKSCLKLFIVNEKQKLIVNKINLQDNMPTFHRPDVFQCHHSLAAVEILKITHTHTNSHHTVNHTTYEHYYALTSNRRHIIKFDTLVKQQGLIWNSEQARIQSMRPSACHLFLILLVSKRSSELFSFCSSVEINKGASSVKYEIVKINGDGSIMEVLNLQFQSEELFKQIGLKRELKIGQVFVLRPDWLSCFSIQNKIVYFSNQTGKLLYIQEIEDKTIKILKVKANNTIIYSYDNHIKLLSLNEQDKTQYFINSKEAHLNQRAGLMFRLSRYGIPQTLLNLLRELRSNHIQLIEMP